MGAPYHAVIFSTTHPTHISLGYAKTPSMHSPMASWHLITGFEHPSNTSHAHPMHEWVPCSLILDNSHHHAIIYSSSMSQGTSMHTLNAQ
jgi:hypothetical protein